ncbi:hypothetical protein RIF29_27400 [Crotalaria pallida]|uniref:Uncharacterized protein n=1 Tax=Crotalaria pallida TaxID=3830 RepID=A0AAN9EPN9_CROPI
MLGVTAKEIIRRTVEFPSLEGMLAEDGIKKGFSAKDGVALYSLGEDFEEKIRWIRRDQKERDMWSQVDGQRLVSPPAPSHLLGKKILGWKSKKVSFKNFTYALGSTSGVKKGAHLVVDEGDYEGSKKRGTVRSDQKRSDLRMLPYPKLPRLIAKTRRRKLSLNRRKQGQGSSHGSKRLAQGKEEVRSIGPTISNSISDSNVHCVNKLILSNNHQVARKLWDVGKKIGVGYDGDENHIINKIMGCCKKAGNQEFHWDFKEAQGRTKSFHSTCVGSSSLFHSAVSLEPPPGSQFLSLPVLWPPPPNKLTSSLVFSPFLPLGSLSRIATHKPIAAAEPSHQRPGPNRHGATASSSPRLTVDRRPTKLLVDSHSSLSLSHLVLSQFSVTLSQFSLILTEP